MNETRRENKEHGHWIEIIVESHWSSLFPWYYSIIFLICVSRSWCTHTPWIKGCSAVGGCRADRYWRFWASVPPRAPLHIPNWLPAAPLPLGRTDTHTDTRTLRVGSIPQSVHHCQGWAACTETWERAQRGKNIPKYSTDLNCLIQKNAIQVFNTFLNFLELSGCMKTEKHKLVVKVAWKICNHIKRVNSKKWANLLWMHCKSDTGLLKQYKNLIK